MFIAINTALFMLGWLTQIITYPGLYHLDDRSFKAWHTKYMKRVTIFAFPLMTAQIIAYIFLLYQQSWSSLELGVVCLMILFTWFITLFWASPIHFKMNNDGKRKEYIKSLLRVNMIRTILWTLIWLHTFSYEF